MRTLIFACFTLLATPALATCDAPLFTDRLTAEERADLDKRASDIRYGEGLVWFATRDDTVLTIIGTIHVWDPSLPVIADFVAADVSGADLLLVEATDEEEAAMERALATEPGLMFITDGPTLPERLDDETWALVSEAASARDIPAFLAAKMQPWFLSLSLSLPPCALRMLTTGQEGLDRMIMDTADAAGVPIEPLEPWRTLFDLISAGDDAEQLEMLMLSLMAPQIQEEVFASTLDSYLAGRTAEIWEISVAAIAHVPGLDPDRAELLMDEAEEQLLLARNRNWIPVIEDAATRHDRIAIAFGAAHLPGDEGVLALLDAAGWSITRR